MLGSHGVERGTGCRSQTSSANCTIWGTEESPRAGKNWSGGAEEGSGPPGERGWNLRRFKGSCLHRTPSPPPPIETTTPELLPPTAQRRYQISPGQGSLEPTYLLSSCIVWRGTGVGMPRTFAGCCPFTCPRRTFLNSMDRWKGHCGTNVYLCVFVCARVWYL